METNSRDQKLLIRTLVDNIYDIQSTRIAMGNRLVASLRDLGIIVATENIAAGRAANKGTTDSDGDEKEKQEKENNALIIKLIDEYRLVSQVYAEQFSSKGSIMKAIKATTSQNIYIHTELTYNMISNFVQMSALEKQMNSIVAKEVQKHPMWDAFFANVRGCGPLMSAVCIAYFDPYKARWPSSFWKYAGLDVVTDENGSHGRRRSDLVDIPYIDKNGNEATKKGLSFNPIVKTKLIGVLGTSFLRAGSEGTYAKLYYETKNRYENRIDGEKLRPIVIHRRAIRYAVKMFLRDMWYAWRTLEGLPTGQTYEEAKLGRAPHHDPRNVVTDMDVLEAAASAAE